MARLVLFLTILAASVIAAAPASATYPGRDGGIAYTNNSGTGEEPHPSGSTGIVLQISRYGSARDLLRCGYDENGLATDPSCTTGVDPSFSPTGKVMAFDAGSRIGLLALKGRVVTLLPGTTADDGDPAFTPDGKRIVFTGANDDGTTDLYVRRADGAGTARLLIRDAAQPAVSVRGVLAFVRDGSVYVRFPKHGKQRRVTAGFFPDWSPDGRRLAIARSRPNFANVSGIGRIYMVRPNGRGLTRVDHEGGASRPAWSPDGRFIAYTVAEYGIFVRRVGSRGIIEPWAPSEVGDDGSSYSSNYDPAWQPLPR